MLQSLRRGTARLLAKPLIAWMVALGFVSSAGAAVVTPGEMLVAQAELRHLQRVQNFLAREDVARNLANLGVDPQTAQLRAEQLSAEELAELSADIEELPAGGVFEVLGVVLVVLIVLEILGVTNIFTKL